MKLTGLITVEKIRDAINALYDSLSANPYPVGTIYMSTVPTSPATLFGGTWEALEQGRVLLSQGENYPAGSTGGEATHTLTSNEMPPHTHSGSAASGGAHTHTINSKGNTGDNSGSTLLSSSDNNGYNKTFKIDSSGSHSHTVTINSTGDGAAHNNMQPYLAVYMWKRTE